LQRAWPDSGGQQKNYKRYNGGLQDQWFSILMHWV